MQLFKKRYPDSEITPYKLRKLYKEHKIRKKLIQNAKKPKKITLEEIVLQANDMHQDIKMAIERNFRIVQLDECMVTKRTIPTHAWTLPKTNINLDQQETNI